MQGVQTKMRCKKRVRSAPLQQHCLEVGDRLVNLAHCFGGAAIELGKRIHGVFDKECLGEDKEFGFSPRSRGGIP